MIKRKFYRFLLNRGAGMYYEKFIIADEYDYFIVGVKIMPCQLKIKKIVFEFNDSRLHLPPNELCVESEKWHKIRKCLRKSFSRCFGA